MRPFTTCLGQCLIAGLVASTVMACAARGGAESGEGIVGTTWLAQTVDGTASPAYPASTLVFSSPSAITGRAGCLSYWATVGISGQQLSIGPFQTTPLANCDQEIPGQAGAFLNTLATVQSFQASEWTLTLSDAGGHQRMTFTRITGPL